MMLPVTGVRYLDDYRLWLRFNDGVEGEVDLAGELGGEVFVPLMDPALFSRVAVDPEVGTIASTNGADLAPEFLYNRMRLSAPK